MEKSSVKEAQEVISLDKPTIQGNSLRVEEINYVDETFVIEPSEPLVTDEISIRSMPDNIRAVLETIPDTDMFKVEEMKKKYMNSFEMTPEQYDCVAEAMVQEGYILK